MAVIPGPPRLPWVPSDPFSPSRPAFVSNDVLLASIVPPAPETLVTRVEKRLEIWSRALERWQARVMAALRG